MTEQRDTAAGNAGSDGAGGAAEGSAAPGRRQWWRTLPFLLVLGVLPAPFGLYFMPFVAIGVLLSDPTRETEVRAGGSVLLFWWAYSFREGDTSPYFGAVLLAIGAVLLARGALARRAAGGRSWWVPWLGAVLAVGLAVAAFVPYGYREPEVSRDEAVRLTLAERAAHPWRGIAASRYLADRGRLRIVHTPVWYVALYETSTQAPRTADGEPCFSRREVWRVDALSGDVSRATYDEASVGNDPCLPVRQGTGEDVRPVPAT
ncbi:MAG TPA: hypothetical protein VFQ85_08790 [Mycobacteriales bacterium]|nr:hypothetical protein [Mycobacteriales bacterium]